jgi:GTPase SAR1 family protein
MDNLTIVKGLILGSSRVGKTQLINQFVNGTFNEESEFGSDMNIKKVEYKGQSY